MRNRVIIGDVHGHYDALMHLLTVASVKDDQLFFLGDLIDRGPQSKQVVDFVKDGEHVCLRGNHEAMVLGALLNDDKSTLNWYRNGATETLQSFGGVKNGLDVLTGYLAWLQALPLYLDLGDLLLVHAGLLPGINLEENTAEECCWIREEFLSSPNPPFLGEKTLLVGHTITFLLDAADGGKVPVGNLAQGPNWYDLETGAYHSKSGWLTALNWDTEQVYQVNVHSQETRVRRLSDSATRVKVG